MATGSGVVRAVESGTLDRRDLPDGVGRKEDGRESSCAEQCVRGAVGSCPLPNSSPPG
jgi:hypothetical protein